MGDHLLAYSEAELHSHQTELAYDLPRIADESFVEAAVEKWVPAAFIATTDVTDLKQTKWILEFSATGLYARFVVKPHQDSQNSSMYARGRVSIVSGNAVLPECSKEGWLAFPCSRDAKLVHLSVHGRHLVRPEGDTPSKNTVRVVVNLEIYKPQVFNHEPVVSSSSIIPVTPVCVCICNRDLDKHPPDVALICQGQRVMAHKLILAGRSEVFEKMFEHGFTESTTAEVTIKDLNPDTVEIMVNYCYSGELQKIPEDPVKLLDLLDAAEKYDLPDVKTVCVAEMVKIIDDDNVSGFIAAAMKYRLDETVMKSLRDYARRRHRHLLKVPLYKKLLSENLDWFV